MTDLRNQIDNACKTAEEFTRLFYKQMDNSRHSMYKLYLDSAVLIWNGNSVSGTDKIQKFLVDIPPTNHKVRSLDAQPINQDVISGKTSFIIQACGEVTYGSDKTHKPFQETFIIVAADGKWKVLSDCIRLHGLLPKKVV